MQYTVTTRTSNPPNWSPDQLAAINALIAQLAATTPGTPVTLDLWNKVNLYSNLDHNHVLFDQINSYSGSSRDNPSSGVVR